MEAERECLNRMNQISITIVRAPAVYGPRDTDVFEFFHAMNKGLQPMIGFNTKRVSLIHVHDLVDGIVLAGEHAASVGQTYFISSEKYYDWQEVGEVTASIIGKKVIRLRIPEFTIYAIAGISELYSIVSRKAVLMNLEKARDIVQDAWTCSIAKARTELGFRQKISLERGITETISWYRQQGWL